MSNNIAPFDIDKALDSVDLSFPNYTPTSQSLEFFNVIRLVTGSDFEFATPMVHYFLVDLLFDNVTREQFPYSKEVNANLTVDATRIAVMMSRGLAKSSVVTAFMPIYLAIKGELPGAGKVYFMLSIAASTEGGARTINKAIRAMCEDSIFCNNYFESMRFTDTEVEFVRKGSVAIGARTFLHRAMGFGSGIRGQRANYAVYGSTPRPDIIAFDDTILNTQAAYSDTIMTTLRETIQSDAINALKAGDDGRIWHVFTPFHSGDVNVQMITSNAYTPVVIPICEKISTDLKEEDFKGAWPNMHTYKSVLAQYNAAVASNATRSFFQERMLRIASEEDRMVPDDLIQWYKRSDIQDELFSYNLYGTSDYTTTGSKGSDFSGQALWAVNSNNDYFMLDLTLRHQELEEQYRETIRMAGYWGRQGKGVELGVENDGQQLGLIDGLKQRMFKYNEFFTIAKQKGSKTGKEGISSKQVGGSKHWRFRMMLPMFQNKKIWFPEELRDTPDMKELMDELRKVTYDGFGSQHDDGIDLISMLGAMDIMIPAKSMYDKVSNPDNGRAIWGSLDRTDDVSAYSSYI